MMRKTCDINKAAQVDMSSIIQKFFWGEDDQRLPACRKDEARESDDKHHLP